MTKPDNRAAFCGVIHRLRELKLRSFFSYSSLWEHGGVRTSKTLPWRHVDDATKRACASIWEQVWPSADGPDMDTRLQRIEDSSSRTSELRWHLLFDDEEVVATARTFRHAVGFGEDPRTATAQSVIALASVCTDPARRGEGLGEAVALEALARASEDVPALFQTGVPEFYEKLGARRITNPISTSLEGARGFHEPEAMIFPADAPWDDDAPIDLRIAGW